MGFFNKPNNPTLNQNNAISLADLALKIIHDGVIIVDDKNIICYANPAAAKMIGEVNIDDIVGIDYSLVLNFNDRNGVPIEKAKNELIAAMNANEPFESKDYSLVTKTNQSGTPVALTLLIIGSMKVVTFRNITEELEDYNAKTEFISTASHEMRTPVASIEGYLGLALNPQTATIDDRARQYLEAAHASSQHLGRLFQDLLDVTKLDDHRAKIHLVPIELTDFAKKMLAGFGPKFNEKQLNYSFGGDNAGANRGLVLSQLLYINVDVDFLREIFNNLIENAIKYTPEGGRVTVTVQGTEGKAVLSVTDTGIGINAEDLKHIFQKFYRADNSQTRTIGGTGLGLYLVKQRTESMGGTVWAESQVGKGTTFYVSLPRISEEDYNKLRIAVENAKQAVA